MGRISERQKYEITTTRVERAKSQNADMLEQISTQKRINHVSDDPVAYSHAVRQRSRLERLKQFEKNNDYAQGYLERAESIVSGIYDNLLRSKELAVAMANDTYGPDSRESTAQEVKQIIDDVTSLANKTFGNRYVFGGFRTQTPPLSKDGEYMGDDGALFLQIDDNSFKQINLQARHLFEATQEERDKGHYGLVFALDVLYQGLVTDDVPMIRRSMEELDRHMSRFSTYQAQIGAIVNSLRSTGKRNEIGEGIATSNISKLEDSDIFKVSSDFKKTESVLQSTLLASTKLLQPSLLNFLQ